MITIYGAARSRATRNIWFLKECGAEWRHVPVVQHYRADRAPGEWHTRSPEFLALSPEGAIPVLEHDGLVLGESLAINLYLAEVVGGDMGPRDAAERARMVAAALYAATSVETQAIRILYTHMDGKADTDAGRAEIDAACVALRRPLAVLEARIAAEGHPVGGRFTVADVNLAEVLRYAQGAPGLIAEFPAVAAWLAAAQARPAFRAMWAMREAEPA
jgi:glutathione S-transferase